MTDVKATLAERGARYGQFKDNAKLCQSLKYTMIRTDGWDLCDADQREALEMIAHKIARVLNGDPNYIDNWVDIAGYATLVADRMEEDKQGDA